MTRRCLFMVVLVLFWPGNVRGQEPIKVDFDGTEAFAQVLQFFPLKPFSSLDDLAKYPANDILVVVFGDVSKMGDLQTLTRFHAAGGALLIACDQSDFVWLRPWRVSIAFANVRQPAADAYRQKPACPLLKEFPAHPLFKNLSEKGLATNGPSFLECNEESFEVVVPFPDSCVPRSALFNRKSPYLVAADAPPAGRLVILAGHGVFFNGMMLQKDNDNFLFARNCIDWLGEKRSGGKRKHVLFIENGKIIDSFLLPIAIPPSLPPPPIPPAELINSVLRRLEEENAFNRILHGAFGRDGLLRPLVLLGSFALLVYGAFRLVQGRFSLEKAVPLVIDPMPGTRPQPTPLEARHLAQAATDNHAELAQVLIRQWFWRHANVDPMLWDQPGFEPPAVALQGTWWQRWWLARRLRGLAELAMTPAPVSVRRLKWIRVALQALSGRVDV